MRKTPSPKEHQAVTHHVGKRLRDKRRRKRLKANELDVMIGERPGTVDKLESGTRKITSSHLLFLGRALGVEVSYFFDRLPEGLFSASRVPVPNKEMDKEKDRFIEAYYAIADPGLRQEVYHIVKLLSDPAAKIENVSSFAAKPSWRRDE